MKVFHAIHLIIVERDPRCKMIIIDPDSAQTNKAILHHVIGSHNGTAGIYAAVLTQNKATKARERFSWPEHSNATSIFQGALHWLVITWPSCMTDLDGNELTMSNRLILSLVAKRQGRDDRLARLFEY